jgi:hypothetical protein
MAVRASAASEQRGRQARLRLVPTSRASTAEPHDAGVRVRGSLRRLTTRRTLRLNSCRERRKNELRRVREAKQNCDALRLARASCLPKRRFAVLVGTGTLRSNGLVDQQCNAARHSKPQPKDRRAQHTSSGRTGRCTEPLCRQITQRCRHDRRPGALPRRGRRLQQPHDRGDAGARCHGSG